MENKSIQAKAGEAGKVEEAKPINIKTWSPQDRPREKMLLKGNAALSDAELIAILLGSGTATLSAVDVAKKLLQSVNHSLHDLALLGPRDLMKQRGIGEAKAMAIVAALELGRRRNDNGVSEKVRITGSRDAYDVLRQHLLDLPHEEFWILLLNRANRVIRTCQISQGGVAGTVADPKIIFKSALADLASGIVIAHNHPSGNLTASQADIDLTKKVKEAARMLEIQLLDHIIIAGQKYFSFADEGLL